MVGGWQCFGEVKKPSSYPDGFQSRLVSKERSAQGLVATAAAAVFPFHLDQPVFAAKGLVEVCAIAGYRRRTKLEVALVGVFLAAGVKPGIQVRIGDGFFGFVRDYVGHAVRAAYACSWAIGAGELGFAAVRALVHVADEGIFNVCSTDGGTGMETAVGAAEAGALFYVRRGQDEVNAVGIQRQVMAGMRADDRGQVPVTETGTLRVVVKHRAGKI